MRIITELVVHCSATKPDQDIGVAEIRDWHVGQNGWNDVGYHYVIRRDGKIEVGRYIDEVGAHAKGHNENSVGICMVGGINSNGNPDANFTFKQYDALHQLLLTLCHNYDRPKILGHRDLPDVSKACPSFDAVEFAKDIYDNS